jgi:hypothetical protein
MVSAWHVPGGHFLFMKPLLTLANLSRLNSLTKYPSIPTYHALGDKGRLKPEVNVVFTSDVHVTEKVDGTNARLVWTPEGVLIGSREDLLWATGDLIHNPALGIVDTLRDFALRQRDHTFAEAIVVFYGEVYGHGVGAAAKQYASQGTKGFRLFDVCLLQEDLVSEMLARPVEQIAAWRERNGQTFASVSTCDELAAEFGVANVPPSGAYACDVWPRSLTDARDFLNGFAESKAKLDGSALGKAEGIVARTSDRSQIAKLRFEDYQRTLGR